jgi:hypothetical protein
MKRRSTAAPAQEKTNRTIESYGHEWAQTRHSSIVRRVYEKGLVPYITGRHLISDLAQLDYPLMREMLASIRGRARASKLSDLPVILENHTKDIRDFSHIERFIAEVSKDPDVKCITLTELARELQQGKFHIKTAAPSGR